MGCQKLVTIYANSYKVCNVNCDAVLAELSNRATDYAASNSFPFQLLS